MHFLIKKQRGIALILVLWIVALLTVIAGNFVFAVRTDTVIAANQVSEARAQAYADAGIHRALYELFKTTTDSTRWLANGAAHEWQFEDAKLKINLLDESGKIDLNTAAEPLLLGLLQSAGLDEESANKLLNAILDWRDNDTLVRINGAEEAEYIAAGLKSPPTNEPFQTLEELQQVFGMTPAIYRAIVGTLTLHSRLPGINSAIAPREVLLAVPRVSAEQVDAYLAERQAALAANQPAPLFPPAASFSASDTGTVFNVRSEAHMPDGSVFIREAVARLTREPKRPIAILSWKEGEAAAKVKST